MHGVSRREPPRMRRDAGQSALFLVSLMAMTTIHRLVLEAEAGGKGKVPIYMPIPIPVPMPMGPTGHHTKFGRHDQQQQHHNEDDSGEGEVKKIYLLQPVQMARPQPNLKGGGFQMGPPVQNHIHVMGHMPVAPARHRPSRPQQQHHHHHHSSGDDSHHDHHHHHQTKSASASEVKILPIVVIPPVAPVPPIQVNSPGSSQVSSHAPRMTLTPHFNNYVVTSSNGARDRRKQGRHTSRGTTFVDSFSEYGGSLGGSVFREQFAARSRPGGSGRGWSSRETGAASGDDYLGGGGGSNSQRRGQRQLTSTRDFDYGDYDSPEPTSFRGSGGGGSSDWDRDGAPAPRAVRPHRRSSSPPAPARVQQQQRAARVTMNSINDIIDAYNRQQDTAEELDLAAGGEQQPSEFTAAQLRLTRVQHHHHNQRPRAAADLIDYKASAVQRQGAASGASGITAHPSNMEISLDELASLGRDARLTERQLQLHHRARAGPGAPDLSSLYYDSRAESTLDDYLANSDRRTALPSEEARGSMADEDEWRFDSIKSVSHEAPPPDEQESKTGMSNSEQQREMKPPQEGQHIANSNSTSVSLTMKQQ